MPAAGSLALSAPERVVDRVHRDAPHRWALAEPATPAGLAERGQLVLGVADDPDRPPAGRLDHPRLARGQPKRRVLALLGHQLNARACGTRHLRAAAGLQLDGVHHRSDRDVAERQSVTRPDVGALPRHQPVALLHTLRRQDVALLAVRVVEQRDPGAPVGVVLDVSHLGRDAVLVTPEIDGPVAPLRAAPLVTHRDPSLVVAPGAVPTLVEQRLLGFGSRYLLESGGAGAPSARRGRLVLANGHSYAPPSKISIESPSASVTMARFWSGRVPRVKRERLVFPLRFNVFTESTRTFQMACTPSPPTVLFARGSTRNV